MAELPLPPQKDKPWFSSYICTLMCEVCKKEVDNYIGNTMIRMRNSRMQCVHCDFYDSGMRFRAVGRPCKHPDEYTGPIKERFDEGLSRS
jgi:hypothetical protein